MGQISVTKSRFPRIENYLLLVLLLWLCMAAAASHFSRLPTEYVFRYSFARMVVATKMDAHFKVPIRKPESEIRQGEFPWLAQPAQPLVRELRESSKAGGEWQKLYWLTNAIVFIFPLLATLIAACVYVLRRRSKDPSAGSKEFVRGVQIKTYKRPFWARILRR